MILRIRVDPDLSLSTIKSITLDLGAETERETNIIVTGIEIIAEDTIEVDHHVIERKVVEVTEEENTLKKVTI